MPSYHKEMFKILYVYPHYQYDTGSPKSMVSMIKGLDRSIYKPVFLATGKGPLIDVLRENNVEIINGRLSTASARQPLRSIANIIKQVSFLKKNGIKVLHLNYFGWGDDIVIAAWLCSIPVILHIHNPLTIHKNNINKNIASRVLICSERQKDAVGNFFYINNKCSVLYNQVDIESFENGKSKRDEFSIDEKETVVGTVAQVCYRKGIDIFVDAACSVLKSYDNLKFIIVGPDGSGEESFSNNIRQLVSSSDYKDKILFIGSREDIPDLLATFDVFLLPTRSEPFGIVIIEAMAAGIPVIASHVGGIPEIICSDKLGRTVKPIEAEGFSQMLNDVLELPDIGKAMGLEGKHSLYGRFDKDSISKRLNNIYRDIVGISDNA